MIYAETLREQDGYRVQLTVDEYPDEPYDDGQSPLIQLDHHGYSWRACHVMTGARPADSDGRIEEAAARWGSDLDLFERYLRAYHGATQIKRWDSQDYTYITYDTAAWRAYAGLDPAQMSPDSVNLDEWRAYCEGDVWFYTVDKRVHWSTDDAALPAEERETDNWVTVDSVGGYFGYEYARESALEAFSAAIASHAGTSEAGEAAKSRDAGNAESSR